MPTNLEYWAREKKKVGGRPAKLNEKKGDRDLEWEIKNKGDIFLLEEQQENFVAAVTKWEMLAATNQMQGENEQQWKKVNENTYDISSIKSLLRGCLQGGRKILEGGITLRWV